MIHYTVADIAKIRLKDFENKGIYKTYQSVYKRVLRDFQSGKIPSKVGTVKEDGKVYRYTTEKLLQAKDAKDLQSLQVLRGGKINSKAI